MGHVEEDRGKIGKKSIRGHATRTSTVFVIMHSQAYSLYECAAACL